ncbi:MAG TPA: alkaline phosphatase D family protein [Kofleriaceae bacterium]|nr:alkaline phosphatase D family protein [Kofleriaceae bacterium]
MMLTRRHFLVGGLTSAAAAACRSAQRGPSPPPQPALGVQSGDATANSAAIWCRADRPGQLFVEWTAGDSFAGARRVAGARAEAATDLCAVADLAGLPPGARIRYRCYFRGASGAGEAAEGSLTTAPSGRTATGLLWSGDLCGQGWGQNPDQGGYRIFDAMAALEPELFVCSGDLIYADDPLAAEVRLPDGRVWRNRVAPAKQRPAQDLAGFRGNFAYNLEDAALRRFAAATPIAAQWDDHEVRNNWFPAGTTDGDPRYRPARSEADLAAMARRALFEYVPFAPEVRAQRRIHRRIARGPLLDVLLLDARSYRASNGRGDEPAPGPATALLGDAQLSWLEAELAGSRALWKIIACDLPIGLVVPDEALVEGFAQGLDSPPAGREHEIARLLGFLHQRRIANVLFVTADVHYAAAHLYHPEAARFGPFTPFHELVAGPLHAGAFGPNPLDPTFGPTVLFQRPPPAQNPAPWDGYLSFGRIQIAADGMLEASWHGGDGALLHRLAIPPAPG